MCVGAIYKLFGDELKQTFENTKEDIGANKYSRIKVFIRFPICKKLDSA